MKLRLQSRHKFLISTLVISGFILTLLSTIRAPTHVIGEITSKQISFETTNEVHNFFGFDQIDESENLITISNYDNIEAIGKLSHDDITGALSINSSDSASRLSMRNINLSSIDIPASTKVQITVTQEETEIYLQIQLSNLDNELLLYPEPQEDVLISTGDEKNFNGEVIDSNSVNFATSQTLSVRPISNIIILGLILDANTFLKEDDPISMAHFDYFKKEEDINRSTIRSGHLSLPYYDKTYKISRNYDMQIDPKQEFILNSIQLKDGMLVTHFEGIATRLKLGPLNTEIIPSRMDYLFQNNFLITIINTLLALSAIFLAILKETEIKQNQKINDEATTSSNNTT